MQIDLYQNGDPYNNFYAAIILTALEELTQINQRCNHWGNKPVKYICNQKSLKIKKFLQYEGAKSFFFSEGSSLPDICLLMNWDIEAIRRKAREILIAKQNS